MLDSSDDDLMPQVFAVDEADVELDASVPPWAVLPTSGHEYLRMVMREAKQHERVKVANIDSKLLERKHPLSIHLGTSVLPAPCGFAPSLSWQEQQAKEFSEVRQSLARQKKMVKKECVKREHGKPKRLIPQKDDVAGWCRLCFGDLNTKRPWDDESSQDVENPRKGKAPLLSIVALMDQPTVAKVLEYHVNWFEATGFSEHQGLWFYALLAVLEMPLDPEVCSLLRTLAKHCSTTRATLESRDDELLAPLNLIICLVARYFNQSDLGDSK